MLPAEIMCTQHRVGEHGEIHKHQPDLRQGKKIDGRFDPFVAIELHTMQARHDYLAGYMNHKSPLVVPDLKGIYPQHYGKVVDPIYNMRDLAGRCDDCRELIEWAVVHYTNELDAFFGFVPGTYAWENLL